MTADEQAVGIGKLLLYGRISAHVFARYSVRPKAFGYSPAAWARFLCRALRLLLMFRHNKPVRTPRGWKLHLYVPAYPTPAFFHTIEAKLLKQPPGPSTVVYSMTKACRYGCPHCYQRNDTGPDIPDAELQRIAARLVDDGVAFFDIEGGEPFLRFERLLGLVRALDERCEIWVNTSGDGVTPERLRELKQAGVAGLMVSIHSPHPQRHDVFCGINGAFGVACEAVRHCRAEGLAAALNSVLSEEDIREGRLDALMELAGDLDCQFVQLIHPKPSGAWLGRDKDMQQDEALLQRVRDDHRRYNSAASPRKTALAAQVFEEQHNVLGCTAGAIDRLYVNANGELQPCEFLNISFGNLLDESYDTVFARMREAFPYPCSDWLCCTQGERIHRFYTEGGYTHTPLPWEATRRLIADWKRGRPTPAYRRLGIYAKEGRNAR